ncbi:thioredoxin family protein [Proteiniborus sp. MB09-C3]|uniref:thioredoxin family protein n=1 Tax=Proteiniborus sp. MB09-C3 TaxID=3050072 RepID=UPI00255371A0|nr:thioredoxin family protein [Proteiniborus sp. MB09-C3]WIV13081.1 thioredoxin family protein [Proteiniborus sp. MB09-C3]
MNGFELFSVGMSFDEFVNTDTSTYKEKTLEILNSISFEDEYIERIKSIDKVINILVCAEMWCPDCMINVPVLEKMKELNPNINISIVKKDGNEGFFSRYTHNGIVKVPTFVFYDENFKELGSFVEHPKKVTEVVSKGNQPNIIVTMRKYRKGEYAQETLKDILEII